MGSDLRINFKLSETAIDPNLLPKRVLRTGDKIPAVGLGTFGSDRFTKEEIADAVLGAIANGYRHIDCASVYMNEPEIGEALDIAIKDVLSNPEENDPRNYMGAAREAVKKVVAQKIELCGTVGFAKEFRK